MIKAIFQCSGVEEGEFGKKGTLIFSDLSEDDMPLASRYQFGYLKTFTKHKPKKGDVFTFDAELDWNGGLQIKRPKNVKKLDLSYLAEGYSYAVTKFLKESRVLTKEDERTEKLAYLRLTTLFGEDIFKFISLPFRLNSLNFFLTEDGQKMVKEEKEKMKRSKINIDFKKESVKLEENKIGEDVAFDKRGQGLMGFLK